MSEEKVFESNTYFPFSIHLDEILLMQSFEAFASICWTFPSAQKINYSKKGKYD